jgi:DNA polymerase (family X)
MSEQGQKYEGKLAMDNRDIARVLDRIADLLEFKDENPFKLRSYRLAAETVAEMSQSVADMAARGGAAELQKIPGVGKSLSTQIVEIVRTGTSNYFEELKQETPETVLDLRRVSGIGLKTSQLLYRDFGVKSLEELRAFAEGSGLLSVPGLGEKTIERIKKSLARIESERGMIRLGEAFDLARAIAKRLTGGGQPDQKKRAAAGARAEVVGQLRRGVEMVDRIEILSTAQADAALEALTSSSQAATVKTVRADRVEAETEKGTTLVVHIVSESDFAAALIRTTGSAEHVRDLEAESLSRGLSFEGFRLHRGVARESASRGRKKAKSVEARSGIEVASEESFYEELGLEYIPAELREGLGELEAARSGGLPRLVTLEDIRGDLHMHTTWSDGRNTVREMIEAARAAGFEYIAITDHTQSSTVANGNKPEELLEEIEEIDSVAREFGDIRVLRGAEVDILTDGSLDMPPEVLDRLDWIVCSIHSGFHQEGGQITDRVIRAMETGYPNVIAHPTGRILGERAAYEIDLERVIEAAKKNDVRLELNANPYRLDLNSYWVARARQSGVKVVISTDSHQTRGFANMYYGVLTARRAWMTAGDILNTLPLAALVAELEKKKTARRG